MEWRCLDCGLTNFAVDQCECGYKPDNTPDINTSQANETEEGLHIPVSTSPFIYGKKIVETISIVSAEVAVSMSYFDQFSAGVTAKFGGNAEIVSTNLEKLKHDCLEKLKYKTVQIGANAIVSATIKYSDIFSGSTLLVTTTGTAVTIQDRD